MNKHSNNPKSVLSSLLAICLFVIATFLGPQAAQAKAVENAPSHNSLQRPSLECTYENPPLFDAARSGKDMLVSFGRPNSAKRLNLVKWSVFLLHDDSKKKGGDLQLDMRDGCGRGLRDNEFNSYKPSSVFTCAAPCNLAVVVAKIRDIRDEVNGIWIKGFDSTGRVRFSDYTAISPCAGCGTFGHIMNWVCKSGEVGLPLAKTVLALTKFALDGIGLLPGGGKAAAGGSLFLTSMSTAMGVDTTKDTVLSTVSYATTKGTTADAMSFLQTSLGQAKLVAGNKIQLFKSQSGKIVEGVLTKNVTIAKAANGTTAVFNVAMAVSDFIGVVESIKSWSSTRQAVAESCAYWDY